MGDEDQGSEVDTASIRKKRALVPQGMLPEFLANAFGELYEEDGLLVLGKGLGWLPLLTSFVRFYADVEEGHVSILHEEDGDVDKLTLSNARPPLVIVLGLRDTENEAMKSMLQTWGTPHHMYPTILTNESGQGSEREVLYKRGGVFSVTSRILIVDLLTNVLNAQDIDGMLVAHAEEVAHQSTEAFIIRIYTNQKRRDQCFIKAFTDTPDGLLSGFARTDKLLRALQVRHLYLYPRFHDGIKLELERCAPAVEELHQKLSPAMIEIQSGIVVAVQACLRELKSLTPFVDWTGSELSVENCANANFYNLIKRQVEKDWHKLKPQARRLVEDLRVLRTLFVALIQNDCVYFWKLINSIKAQSASARHPSMWLLTGAGEFIFKKAKERVYKIQKGKKTSNVPNPVSRLIPVLEENPKWRLLRQVLGEIKEKDKKRDASGHPTTVLVMTKDERSIETLRSYLVMGRDRTMATSWKNYLEKYNDRARATKDIHQIGEESRLLLEEEGSVKRMLKSHYVDENWKKRQKLQLNQVPSFVKKRRRIALEKGRGKETGDVEHHERQAVLDEAVERTDQELQNEVINGVEEVDASDLLYENMFQASYSSEPRVVLRSYASVEGDTAFLLLQYTQPEYVVMYDADICFTRAVEMYSALKGPECNRLSVYFLIYEASAEQKAFMKSIEREQKSFERLIHHKRTMPPPILQVEGTQEMQQALSSGSVASTYMGGSLPLAADTRTRGKAKKDEKRDIAVDVREFRSALPSILHQGGMRLAPATLNVGDFVLSNVHCVERKSISDLFGSFASGRLYAQTESMSKYYKCPCLLIEFDPEKAFCLQSSNELSMDIRTESICSRMALLTMHFPKLRILWSRSPHETLRIFKELKKNHGEVDIDRAIEVGRGDSVESLLHQDSADGEEEDEINEAARDMLLRLPGVNMHNARRIMRECDSLHDLAQMDRDRLREIAGPVAGQKLYTFFGQDTGAI